MDEVVQAASPQVSVLIYSRNAANALRRCLAALDVSKNRDRIEILVMDNGSTDGSAHIDADFPKCTVLRMPRNFGWTRAMNIGMRTATGEFALFLDPVVLVEPDTISRMAAVLEGREDATAVCPVLRDESGAALPTIRALPGPGNPWPEAAVPPSGEEPVAVGWPSPAALMVRRGFVKGMNFVDQRYGHSWADAEICWQIRRAGKKILLVPDVQATWIAREEPTGDVYEADRIAGASTYLGKHFGFFAGLKLRIAAIFSALLRLRIGLLSNLVSGQKIDGTQGND